jgi:hypothetical protein
MSDRGSQTLLIFVNAFAAASSFVGAILIAGRAPDLLAIPTFIVGFIGLGYFLKRAEHHRESLRREQGDRSP